MCRRICIALLLSTGCAVTPSPTASFTATPVPTDPLLVRFDAGTSVPGAGGWKSLVWNFGLGSPRTETQEVSYYRYPSKAYYAVTLEVTDQNLGKATAAPQLVLAGNFRPEAVLVVPSEVYLGSRVRLDGSRSRDRDGQVARWEFSLDGETIYGGPESSTTHTFDRPDTFVARLRVFDSDGEACLVDEQRKVTALAVRAPDRAPPQVEIVSPAEQEAVTGVAIIRARAEDDISVAEVEFLVDGSVIMRDREPPYDVPWDSLLVLNGPHTIEVRAFDTANNWASDSVTVQVRNP